MKNTTTYINQIFITHILAYLIPSFFLTSYGALLTWIDMDMAKKMLMSPLNGLNSIIFIVLIPFLFKKQLIKLVEEAKQGNDEVVRKKIYWGLWFFLITSIVYALTGFPFLKMLGFPQERILSSVILILLCNLMVPIPFLIIILQKMDILFSELKIKKTAHFIGIEQKIRIINVLPSVASIGFLILGIYMLMISNMTSDGKFTMPINEMIMRLSIIGIISLLFIVIPMLVLGKKISKQIQQIEEHSHKMATGDLRDVLQRTSSDELGLVIEAVNMMRNDLHKMMKGIQQASANIQKVGGIVQNSSLNLAKESNTQVIYTSDMSNSIEQMTMNIEGNSSSAEQCDQLSSEVGKLATNTYEIVLKNVQAIQEISHKVKSINEIANQTNLLAINATIEAASAGSHGLGFAVVAKEVRVLAEKSKVSAKDINELSTLCLELVEKTQEAIQTLKPKAQTTSQLSEQISKVSQITRDEGLQVSDKIHHLNTVAQNNAEISSNLSHQAKGLNQQVQILNRLIEGIKI